MSMADKKEPNPIPNKEVETWEEVIKDYTVREDWYPPEKKETFQEEIIQLMRDRNEFGKKKYGTPIQAHNGRDNLTDAFQEMLDAVVYLKNQLLEKEDDEMSVIYTMALTLLEVIYLKKNSQ